MTTKRNRLVIVGLLIIILNVSLGTLNNKEITAREHELTENLAIVLLIDVSGSMSRTDPQRLRETAAGVFIDMLSPEDYLGIVTFDHEVEIVVPLEQVKDYSNKKKIKEILYPKLDPRGFTDYVGALETVFNHLQEVDTKNAQPVVVFLTDGDPNPYAGSSNDSVFMVGYMEKLWNTVRGYTLERYPIYSVGFSDEIDPGVLEKISLDTRGGSFILSDPGEILVSLFKLLGGLKNRQIVIDEALAAGTEGTFPFYVDEYTRQINLVVASQGKDTNYSLLSPDGSIAEPDQVSGILVTEEEGSSLIVLQQLQEKYFGEWTLFVSGTQSIQVLGDKDYFVQVTFEEPSPFSQQPINEPLEIRVAVNRKEVFEDVPLRAEVHVTGPGIDRAVFLSLEEVNEGVFTGTFNRFTRMGTYNLEVRLLSEDELLSTTSTTIYGLVVPSITTDFYVEEEYIVGEEIIATASLFAGGNRLTEGRDLEVEDLKIFIVYEDGTRVSIPFFDSGNYQEHGDLRARDGIWTNRYTFDKAGNAEAYLISTGTYRGTEYLLEKRLGDISVFATGRVLISTQETFWSVPGRMMDLPLRVTSESEIEETLIVSLAGNVGIMEQQKVKLEPGEIKTLSLPIKFNDDLSIGNYQLQLILTSERESTILEPNNLVASVELMTARAAFLRNYLNTIGMAIAAIVLFLIILVFVIVFDLLLYKINIAPQTKIKGSLFYRKIGSIKGEPWQEVKFKGVKDKVLITYDPDNHHADFYIKDSEFSYNIEIKAVWPNGRRRFIQGLRSLKKKYLPVKLILRCTPPGVIEFQNRIYTEKELFHEDRFESGEFSFHYVNLFAKWDADKGIGIDILGERLNNINHEDSQSV